MVGGGDLARVAKGAGKVAKALLQVEGPAVARQALRLKEHGGGLASSLKNVSALVWVGTRICRSSGVVVSQVELLRRAVQTNQLLILSC